MKQAQDKAIKELKEQSKTEEELELENEKELEETIKRVEKERKKQEKKEREKKAKVDLRQKMSVIASTEIYNQNDEVLFDRKTFDKLQKMDIEELDYDVSSEEEDFNDQHQIGKEDIVIGKQAKKR